MGLLDTTMEVARLAGQVANPQLVQEAMKANKEALELSRENLELHKRIVDLEAKMRDLQAHDDLMSSLYRLDGILFRDNDPEPYCPVCWDADRKLIHLKVTADQQTICTICRRMGGVLRFTAPSREISGAVPVRF